MHILEQRADTMQRPHCCKAHLIGRVKEGEQSSLLHHLQDALPLVRGGVHPRGVMGTGMQQHH